MGDPYPLSSCIDGGVAHLEGISWEVEGSLMVSPSLGRGGVRRTSTSDLPRLGCCATDRPRPLGGGARASVIAVRMRVLAHWLIQEFDVTSIALPAAAAVPLGRAQPPKYTSIWVHQHRLVAIVWWPRVSLFRVRVRLLTPIPAPK